MKQEDGGTDVTKQPPNYPTYKHASHTFSQRPSAPQIAAYIVICAQLTIYFTCILHLREDWVVFGLYVGSGAIMVVSAIISSCSNPTDPVVYRYKWSKIDKAVSFQSDFSRSYYCEYCDSFCSLKSKHCKICNRCVEKFDHHCIWINNCVGNQNYRVFFVLILSTFAHMVLFLVAGGLASTATDIRQNIGRMVPIWAMMLVLGVLGFLLMQLILLHIYLQCKDITTYEFLQQRSKNQELQKMRVQREKIEEQRRRRQAADQAKDNQGVVLNQSQKSNAGIKMTEQKAGSNNTHNIIKVQQLNIKRASQDDEVQTQTKPISREKIKTLHHSGYTYHNYAKRKASSGDIEEQDQREDFDQDMPRLVKKNSSLKYLFGSSEVESPRKSKRKGLDRAT